MFTNKINDMIKVYLDRYLFGFDKNQLNLSILKGNFRLEIQIRIINEHNETLITPFTNDFSINFREYKLEKCEYKT